MKTLNIILIAILVLIAPHSEAKKKLYKWVDENGKVTYSDQVPPEQIKKEHQEINKTGVVVDKIENALTQEEKVAIRHKKQLEKEAQQKAEKEELIRKNIMLAYTNENEIVRLKDERISALEKNIESANQSLEFQKISREQILSRAADSERDGLQISKALKSRIVTIEEKIKYQNQYIENKTQEIKNVELKFKKDLNLYRNASKGE